MARKQPDFPVEMTHPDIEGSVTHAASPSSLKVLEAHGWKRSSTTSSSTPKKSEA